MVSEPMEAPQGGDQQQPADALAAGAGAPPPPAPGAEAPVLAPQEGAV